MKEKDYRIRKETYESGRSFYCVEAWDYIREEWVYFSDLPAYRRIWVALPRFYDYTTVDDTIEEAKARIDTLREEDAEGQALTGIASTEIIEY